MERREFTLNRERILFIQPRRNALRAPAALRKGDGVVELLELQKAREGPLQVPGWDVISPQSTQRNGFIRPEGKPPDFQLGRRFHDDGRSDHGGPERRSELLRLGLLDAGPTSSRISSVLHGSWAFESPQGTARLRSQRQSRFAFRAWRCSPSRDRYLYAFSTVFSRCFHRLYHAAVRSSLNASRQCRETALRTDRHIRGL